MTAPEFRRCPIRGHRTIIAPNRGDRPIVTGLPEWKRETPAAELVDPFLAGNEDQTAAELLAVPGDGAWSVRVIENLYPTLRPEAGSPPPEHNLFRSAPAVGHQEVIVECPQFETELANLPVSQICDVLSAWQQRLRAIQAEGRFDYAYIFKNSGARAGTSLPHSHSQLIAATEVPDAIQREHATARDYFHTTGTTLQEAVIAAERKADRVVLAEPAFVAFCPFASRFAFETCIAPTNPGFFTELAADSIHNLSTILHRILTAFLGKHPGAAYNLLLHTTPFSSGSQPWFCWRLEICPRLAQLAGFELGTGWFINSVRPIDAANQLRKSLAG